MLKNSIASLFLLSFVLTSGSAKATEGFWLPDQVIEHAGSVAVDPDKARALLPKLVSIGTCTGSFVSANGLILTQQQCAAPILNQYRTEARDIYTHGYQAKTAAEELGSLERLLPVTLITDIHDISAKLLKDLKGSTVGEKIADLDQRIKAHEEACKIQGLSCRVVESAVGQEYIEVIEETFNDVRLVYAPSIQTSFAARSAYRRHLGGDIAPFALLRLYKDGKPYRSKDHLQFQTSSRVRKGDDIMVAGYTNVYKRYYLADEVASLFEGGLMYPSSEWLHLYLPYMDQRMKASPRVAMEYDRSLQSLHEWNTRIDDHDELYPKLKFQKKIAWEREMVNEFYAKDPTFHEAYDKLRNAVHLQLQNEKHQQRFENVLKLRSMSFLKYMLDGKETGKAPKPEWVKRRLQEIDLEAELHGILYGLEVIGRYPYAWAGQDVLLKRLIAMPLKEKEKALRDVLQKSTLFHGTFDLTHEPLLEIFQGIQRLSKVEFDAKPLVAQKREAEFVVAPRWAALMKRVGQPYYPAISAKVPGFVFGKVRGVAGKTGTGQPITFDADIEACFRNMRGAPAFDSKGQWIGFYANLNYHTRFDVNFYHDPQEYETVHVTLDKVEETLRKAGAESLLQELEGKA